jgi:DNA invertase Pin-like site-specific DNA recombinase
MEFSPQDPDAPTDAVKNMFFNILATFAQFEREQTQNRIRESVHGIRSGKIQQRGKGHRLLSYDAIVKIRQAVTGGDSYRRIAEDNGVSPSTVSRIMNRKICFEEKQLTA